MTLVIVKGSGHQGFGISLIPEQTRERSKEKKNSEFDKS